MAELCDTFPIVCVVGPTASGKTGLSVQLAKHFNAEIVSCDSMQLYKDMNIGTAKPTLEEMDGVKHHLIDFLNPEDEFSLKDYITLAKEKIAEIISRGGRVILTGGTGLYYSSLINGIEIAPIESSLELREEFSALYDQIGGEEMLLKMAEFDKPLSEKLHANDKNRIIRAFEVFHQTGTPLSEHQRISRIHESPFKACVIGLDYSNRETLYERINKRVDIMLNSGLLDEAQKLFERNLSHTASQAIAYKELFPYFKGEKSLDECVEFLKMQSRRYAKRQLTWFRRDEKINWIQADECDNVFERAVSIISESEIF